MKNLKRIICALFTLVLSFCAVNAVMAATTGTVTVKNSEVDRYYSIYRIFDLTLKGEGKTAKVAYTINSEWEDFFYTENEGVITLNSNGYISTTDTGSLNQVVINNKVYYINVTESNIKNFTKDALTYAGTKTPVARLEGNGGDLVFSKDTAGNDLALGYYLVYPEGATEKDNRGTICSITSTVPNASVEIKATYPTINKTVEDDKLDVGQEANFTITGIVPDTTGFTTYTYEINDTMSNGLLFNQSMLDKLTVKIGNDVINPTTDENVTLTLNGNGFKLNFDMTKYQTYVGQTITVEYSAIVTEAAISKNDVTNSATLTYSNDPKNSESKDTTPEIEIPVYTSAIKVTKVDGADGKTPLAGASFVLKKLVDGEFVYYSVTGSGESMVVTWVDSIEDGATVLTTDETGIITFKGIENGTYYLEETVAPEGFNKLTEDEMVTVGPKDNKTIAVTKETTVKNFSGTALPSTGGMGTTLFVVIGSLLAIASAVIFVTNKRMAKEM